MDIKFAHVLLALDKLKDEVYSNNVSSMTLNVTTTEDDPGSGKMVECITLKCSASYGPSSYDQIKTNITKEFSVEVFSISENRPPRLTIVQTRDLEADKK